MTQADEFAKGEGDAWLRRNKSKLKPKDDQILYALDQLVGVPRNGKYLEIGCANAWRLLEIKKKYGATVSGIDPSLAGVTEGLRNGVDIVNGVATNLPWDDNYFDTVIYGFCLYLCDRSDLFKIVAEGDRVLKDKGLLVIWDFYTDHPCKNPYTHRGGVWSYKQDYSRLFTANPAYSHALCVSKPGSVSEVTILRKDIERGWPLCE